MSQFKDVLKASIDLLSDDDPKIKKMANILRNVGADIETATKPTKAKCCAACGERGSPDNPTKRYAGYWLHKDCAVEWTRAALEKGVATGEYVRLPDGKYTLDRMDDESKH